MCFGYIKGEMKFVKENILCRAAQTAAVPNCPISFYYHFTLLI